MRANLRDLPKRDIYTTGQIAYACGVAPRTVANWIDQGLLKGYRVPGSTDRRVTRATLLEFMLAHGMPTNRIMEPAPAA